MSSVKMGVSINFTTTTYATGGVAATPLTVHLTRVVEFGRMPIMYPKVEILHVKFTANAVTEFLILSFKEK